MLDSFNGALCATGSTPPQSNNTNSTKPLKLQTAAINKQLVTAAKPPHQTDYLAHPDIMQPLSNHNCSVCSSHLECRSWKAPVATQLSSKHTKTVASSLSSSSLKPYLYPRSEHSRNPMPFPLKNYDYLLFSCTRLHDTHCDALESVVGGT